MKSSKDGCGYLGIMLRLNNKSKRFLIHRLVALTFIPNLKNKRTINHDDGNKENNHVSNLSWMTYSENAKHAYDILGRINPFKGLLGSKSPYSKPINQLDLEGNFIKEWGSINEAGRSGFNISCVCKCLQGKRNHHKYFKWEYKNK